MKVLSKKSAREIIVFNDARLSSAGGYYETDNFNSDEKIAIFN